MVASTANAVLDVGDLPADASGCILVGGSLVTYDALLAARERGAVAVVAGGFHDADLRRLLGYDLGVAITGNETLGITLVVTEGFGAIAMADRTFRLLQQRDGRTASVNGATQIRAGVMRPEIIVPLTPAEIASTETKAKQHAPGLQIGDVVRIIRQPYFGSLGKVVELPAPLQALESESRARVLVLEIDGVGRWVVARANVEAIEEN
jgi:transcription antitermination factor NusG